MRRTGRTPIDDDAENTEIRPLEASMPLSIKGTYNDGRKKSLFCTAVNLLELKELEEIIAKLDQTSSTLSQKEKASLAAALLKDIAAKNHITLKLRKK